MSEATWPTVGEASHRLGISKQYINRLLKEGRLSGLLRGKTWLIEPESLRQYEAARAEKLDDKAATNADVRL